MCATNIRRRGNPHRARCSTQNQGTRFMRGWPGLQILRLPCRTPLRWRRPARAGAAA